MPNFFNLLGNNQNNQQNVQNRVNEREEQLTKAIKKATTMGIVGDTRSSQTDKLAVSTIKPDWYPTDSNNKDGGFLGYWSTPAFREYLNYSYNNNKESRLNDFRNLAEQEKLEACIHEYAISCIASHDNLDPVVGKLKGDYDEEIKTIIEKEIAKVIEFFKFDKNGQKYFKEFLKTGELCFENVFSNIKPELGILDVKAIPPENITPFYRNEYNEEIEGFILLKPSNLENQNGHNFKKTTPTYDTIPMARSQVTYCNSGEFKMMGNQRIVKPLILKGQDAQKKLSLIESAIVINAMTNGPERLLWQFPTGNMSPADENRYMTNLINGIKKKKGADGNGNIIDRFNTMSVTEDYYVPISSDGTSAKVERIQGSQAFTNGFNGILSYFHQKVFEDMHVPVTRLNPDATQSDGQTITMQELAFAERVIDIQKQFAEAIKTTVITHLKLKGIKLHNESCKNSMILENKKNGRGLTSSDDTLFEQHIKLIEKNYYNNNLLPSCSDEDREKLLHELGQSYWDQYELREKDINIKFSLPTTFLTLREQQQMDLKFNNFNNLASTGYFSVYLLAKEHLEMSDDEIKKHLSWRKVEAKKTWELSQIEAEGPEFRSNAQEAVGLGGGSALGGGSELEGDVGGAITGDETPDFGEGDGLDKLGDEPEVDAPEVDPEEPEEPVEEV